MKRSFIVHPILFAVFPVLFLYSHNIGKLPPGAMYLPVAITLSFTILSWVLLGLAVKDKMRAGLIVTIFLFLFFSYGQCYQAIDQKSFDFTGGKLSIDTNMVLLAIWVIIFSLGTFFLVKTRRSLNLLTSFLNIVSAVLILASFINIGIYKSRTKRALRDQGAQVDISREGRDSQKEKAVSPNIFLIVVDAYAAEDVLKEVYGYDNKEFIDYLRGKGFYVLNKSTSNYCQTSLALSTSLNLAHFDNFLDYVNIESNNFDPVRHLIRYNSVFRFLKQLGYKIVAFSSGCSETEIRNADIYITPRYVFDNFQNTLINMTPVPAVLEIIGSDNQYDLHRKRLLFILDNLGDTAELNPPVFVFAHIELPHPPFVFGPNGEGIDAPWSITDFDANWLIRPGRLTRDEYIKQYRDQLIFLNKKLKSAIDEILSRSKEPPIIILQSDHGPRSMLVWEDPNRTYFKECFSILNAYYLPEYDYVDLYDGITPVNSFRLLLNLYFGTNLELLEDKVYFSTARNPFKLIDVTDEVRLSHDELSEKRCMPGEDLKVIEKRSEDKARPRPGTEKAIAGEIESLNMLGKREGLAGNLDRAILLFNRALELDPNNAETYNNLGYAYYLKGEHERAIGYFKKALEVDPGHEKARINIESMRKLGYAVNGK